MGHFSARLGGQRYIMIEQVEPRLLLAFTDDQVIFYSENRPDGPGMYTANADGSNVQQVPTQYATSLVEPRFNPDETKILFSSQTSLSDNSSEIFITDADGSNLVQITDNEAWDGEAAWTPDGDRIVFVSERDGNEEIYIMNADGSNPVRLTNNIGIDASPSVHPSGRFIAFESDRAGDLDLCQMRIDGSDFVQIEEPDSEDFDPVFSPDGRSFVFRSDRDTAEGELYLATDSTPEVLRLTDNFVIELSPSFGPDGQLVASVIVNNPGDPGEIWFNSVTGTNLGEDSITTGFDDTDVQWASAPEIAVWTPADDTLTVWGTGTTDSVSLSIDSNSNLITTRGDRSVSIPAIEVGSINVFLGAGNDVLTAQPGDGESLGVQRFYAIGGPGDDVIVGGDGNDTLTGGSGRNTLFGGNGDDRLNGSSGRDFLYGDGGNDRLYGNAGNDYLVGGGNIDRIWGGAGDDFLSGNGQNDKLFGEAGSDQLFGGDHNDFLDGGDDADTLHGQDGSDSGNAAPEDELFSIESF